MPVLAEWQNFYVILGSSAGALIGLQFVLITLVANIPTKEGGEQAGHAFATPTIVHFGVVLLVAAVITAPWHELASATIIWGILGGVGIVYAAIVGRRMRRQTAYQPEFEDWLCHVLLPITAYAVLAVSAFSARRHVRAALFAVGAAVLLLLFVGIHNAWDAATYHVFVVKPKRHEGQRLER